jgi:hypothetical protein
MNSHIKNINDALKFATIRMSWYSETGESRYLIEAMDWIRVADIYAGEIKKNETYQSAN